MKKLLLLISLILITTSCSLIKTTKTLGVWWWDDSLDQTYLDFASDNNVTEIYYCTDISEETEKFIKSANEKDIKVYYLTGDYSWIYDDTNLFEKIDKYLEFNANTKYKFAGIHLDIEPHQSLEFSTKRIELITNLINLIIKLNLNYPQITFDYDIPFWLDDIITINNIQKPAYEWVLDYANRMFIMSYRDTYEAVIDVSKEEIEYANNNHKHLALALETYSIEGDFVSFYEEDTNTMYDVMNNIYSNDINEYIFGIAIHDIKNWYNLANK